MIRRSFLKSMTGVMFAAMLPVRIALAEPKPLKLVDPEEDERRSRTHYWSGATSDDWFNPANWAGGEIPRCGDDVVITEGSGPCTAGSDVTIGTLTICGGSLSFRGRTGGWIG